MSEVIDNARAKVEEARFFLELMDRVEDEPTPLTSGRAAEDEYVFLLSAFLNACYSAVRMLEREKKLGDLVRSFRNNHPQFYGSATKGGRRAQSVYLQPVVPKLDGYIPPPGGKVIFRGKGQSQERYVPPKWNQVNFDELDLGNAFYFETNTPQNPIGDLCAEHLSALNQFIDRCMEALT